jgi:hypothetical protein
MRWPLSTTAELYRIFAILFADQTRAQIAQIGQANRAQQRPMEVHVYRPSPEILEELAGFLNFERSYVEKLIDAGYQDTVNHSGKPVTSATIPLDPSFFDEFLHPDGK